MNKRRRKMSWKRAVPWKCVEVLVVIIFIYSLWSYFRSDPLEESPMISGPLTFDNVKVLSEAERHFDIAPPILPPAEHSPGGNADMEYDIEGLPDESDQPHRPAINGGQSHSRPDLLADYVFDYTREREKKPLFSLEEEDSVDQRLINYMADNLQVKFEVTRQLTGGYSTTVTLTNAGDQPILGSAWHIVLCYNNAVMSLKRFTVAHDAFSLEHVEGNIFILSPTTTFHGLPAGQNVQFVLGKLLSSSDVYANWYVNVKVAGAKKVVPKVIKSTTDDAIRVDFSKLDKLPLLPGDRYRGNAHTPQISLPSLGLNAVIPAPMSIEIKDQKRILTVTDWSDWSIIYSRESERMGRYLSDKVGLPIRLERREQHMIQITDWPAKLKSHTESRFDKNSAYQIIVNSKEEFITIQGRTQAAIFYGIQTFLSLACTANGTLGPVTWPGVRVFDAARFAYRGVMLDLGRNFVPKHEVYKVLDSMAMYKMNKLHLHLSDDQGWRLEIPGLDELTELGGFRGPDLTEQQNLRPYFGSGPSGSTLGSGYFSVQDYRDILRYARDRFIDIVPEIDLPGHSHAAIRSMEARYRKYAALRQMEKATEFLLSDPDDKSVYQAVNMFRHTTINLCMQSAVKFTKKVLYTLMKLHQDIQPLRTFHIGGDEVPERALTGSPLCEEFRKLHPEVKKTSDLKQMYMIQVAQLINETGLQMQVWEDGIHTHGSKEEPFDLRNFPTNDIVAQLWKKGDHKRAYELVKRGYQIILSEGTHLYFDHPYEVHLEERGFHWATAFSNTEKVFKYRPERDGHTLLPLYKSRVLGMECAVWGETVQAERHLEALLYPRLLAVAERAWRTASWEVSDDEKNKTMDWTRFANIVSQKELPRLENLGVQYNLPPPGAAVINGKLSCNNAMPGLPVVITTDLGETWRDFKSPELPPKGRIGLASRSYDGKRRGRVVWMTIP